MCEILVTSTQLLATLATKKAQFLEHEKEKDGFPRGPYFWRLKTMKQSQCFLYLPNINNTMDMAFKSQTVLVLKPSVVVKHQLPAKFIG